MEWIEGRIYTTSSGTEPITAMLMERGIDGVIIDDSEEMKSFLQNNPLNWDYVDDELLAKEETDVTVTFYVADNPFGADTIISIKDGLNTLRSLCPDIELGSLILELVNVNDEQWLNEWKKYYKPFLAGNRVVVKPFWETYEKGSFCEDEIIFNNNPGNAFGTGLHQTTRLCILELEKYVREGHSVLDLGCGSGILSVIAVQLGAAGAVAVDIDAAAVETACENALLNGVTLDKYLAIYGNVLTDDNVRDRAKNQRPRSIESTERNHKYDIVAANIVANAVIGLSGFVAECIDEDGIFISSGIIDERVEDVCSALSAHGFEVRDTLDMDGWVCIAASVKKKGSNA